MYVYYVVPVTFIHVWGWTGSGSLKVTCERRSPCRTVYTNPTTFVADAHIRLCLRPHTSLLIINTSQYQFTFSTSWSFPLHHHWVYSLSSLADNAPTQYGSVYITHLVEAAIVQAIVTRDPTGNLRIVLRGPLPYFIAARVSIGSSGHFWNSAMHCGENAQNKQHNFSKTSDTVWTVWQWDTIWGASGSVYDAVSNRIRTELHGPVY